MHIKWYKTYTPHPRRKTVIWNVLMTSHQEININYMYMYLFHKNIEQTIIEDCTKKLNTKYVPFIFLHFIVFNGTGACYPENKQETDFFLLQVMWQVMHAQEHNVPFLFEQFYIEMCLSHLNRSFQTVEDIYTCHHTSYFFEK